ncbi:MAG: carboxypeptidase-like regulatory domain-containing protein [Terriglobales bacterium]|jgi:carboxypeptidase family protein
MPLQLKSGLLVLALLLSWISPSHGQTPQQAPAEQQPGTISGTVVDPTGAVIVGARVKLTRDNPLLTQEALTGDNGQFSFANLASGPFQLTISSTRFATHTSSGILQPGETYIVPPVAMAVAANVEVQVGVAPEEIAEEQIKIQEKQRVLGFIPNFYVSYIPNAVPLTPKQKFKLAWKTTIDPITILLVGAVAGVEQAQNHFRGYGQGAEGYGKRYGAGYADTVTATFIGGAILPSVLKQDPRYFYKGTGSTRSRALYAIANSVICKGDNRRWQPNYSNVLGNLAAGGISNAYYPADDRNGAALTFENAAIGIGATAIANLFQEFVVRKFTPKVPNNAPAQP